MADIEFYRDEAGYPCARGEDKRLATFIQTDLQGSTQIVLELIARLEDAENEDDFTGNAHTLYISKATVTIDSNFDDEAPSRRLSREDMLQHLKDWLTFINTDATHS